MVTFGLRRCPAGDFDAMSEREQYGKLADELEDRADTLAQHSDRLGDDIADAREDWKRKRADAAVPGATPDWDDPDEDEDEDEDDGKKDEQDEDENEDDE
jgi:hypothetical protein